MVLVFGNLSFTHYELELNFFTLLEQAYGCPWDIFQNELNIGIFLDDDSFLQRIKDSVSKDDFEKWRIDASTLFFFSNSKAIKIIVIPDKVETDDRVDLITSDLHPSSYGKKYVASEINAGDLELVQKSLEIFESFQLE